MKKMTRIKQIAGLLLCGAFLSSCIGSFNLTNQVLDWNRGVGNKFVNELVFLGLNIIPVYPITVLADAVVLNSIEFWGGDSGLAMNKESEKIIENKGRMVRVTTTENGYHLEQVGAEHIAMDLVYSSDQKTWSVVTSEGEQKIMKRVNERKVMMYLPDSTTVETELTAEGIASFQKEHSPLVSAAY